MHMVGSGGQPAGIKDKLFVSDVKLVRTQEGWLVVAPSVSVLSHRAVPPLKCAWDSQHSPKMLNSAVLEFPARLRTLFSASLISLPGISIVATSTPVGA